MQNGHCNVLVVAYYFPPMGLSGVQRTLKFAKYLPEFGWKPTVLTVHPSGYAAVDDSLLEELNGRNVEIVRTDAAGPGRVFAGKGVVPLPSETKRKLMSRISDTLFIPDNKRGWKRRAIRRALALHEERDFDVIFATAPPFTDFLIGAEVKRMTGRPLVLDYRDPWVDYPFKFYPTPFHKQYSLVLERKTLRASDRVVTTNRRVKELLIGRYPFLTYHDVEIIPQGFDQDDIDLARRTGTQPAKKNTAMRMTYAGVFWEDRKPDYFLQALHDLFQEQPDLRGNIEARFIGNFRDQNLRLVEQLGLTDTVTVLGYLPHHDCVRELLASDILWVIVGDTVGSPGKTYEYIGARKPILGLVPEGFLRNTILEAGGTVVPPTDVTAIKEAIRTLYGHFKEHSLKGPTEDFARKFDRRSLTGRLVRILDSLREV